MPREERVTRSHFKPFFRRTFSPTSATVFGSLRTWRPQVALNSPRFGVASVAPRYLDQSTPRGSTSTWAPRSAAMEMTPWHSSAVQYPRP